MGFYETTVTEDGNVLNWQEHDIISIHYGERQRANIEKQSSRYKTK
jgi:hypothetical protein